MSEQKILDCLEEHPAGLSISDIAEETELHRNTISPKIEELVEDGEVEKKEVGTAKLYYLKEHAGLHEMESQYEGENINVGIGVSDLSDGFDAAQSAAKQAANQASGGEQPTFSLVFVSSEYNDQIEQVTKGFNKILGEDWIGCTSDSELNSILGFSQGTLEVLSINSKYLHFSPVLVEDYRDDPETKAEKATQKAVSQANIERSVHATSQYMRSTKKSFSDIIKNPPYFVLTFPGGAYINEDHELVPGREVEFLQGIKNTLGPHIPILGGSASLKVEKNFSGEVGANYVFANGKYAKSGAITCFVVSELYFSYGLEHGFKPTNKNTVITDISGNGRIINELNNKPALEEYLKLLGKSEDEISKKSIQNFIKNPISIFDASQNIYPKVSIPSPNDDPFLEGSFKYGKGQSVMISEFDLEKSIDALKGSIDNSLEGR
ncbi:MAG: FIST N-terminal domain-containing protein, partial [Candidatus Aenigmatarchaeota archaeon]